MALTNAAANEAPNVNRYEATTRGDVTVSQNCGQVSANVRRKAADSGIRTIKLKYSSAKPSARSNPGRTLWRLSSVRDSSIASNLRDQALDARHANTLAERNVPRMLMRKTMKPARGLIVCACGL